MGSGSLSVRGADKVGFSLPKEHPLRKLRDFWRTHIEPVDHQVDDPYYFTLAAFPKEVKEAVEKLFEDLDQLFDEYFSQKDSLVVGLGDFWKWLEEAFKNHPKLGNRFTDKYSYDDWRKEFERDVRAEFQRRFAPNLFAEKVSSKTEGQK